MDEFRVHSYIGTELSCRMGPVISDRKKELKPCLINNNKEQGECSLPARFVYRIPIDVNGSLNTE